MSRLGNVVGGTVVLLKDVVAGLAHSVVGNQLCGFYRRVGDQQRSEGGGRERKWVPQIRSQER